MKLLRRGRRGLRLPASAHTSQQWRIHELAGDFRLEDVWAVPTPGGPDDFGKLLQLLTARDGPLRRSSSSSVRALWAARRVLGALFGWDNAPPGRDGRLPTLRDRLPADLSCAGDSRDLQMAPFTTLYLLHDEWAAELVNKTMHGVVHIGWVEDGSGGYRGQLAVLVRPNGLFGAAYMAAIMPLRHLIVYPLALRQTERAWRATLQASEPRRLAGALVDDPPSGDREVDLR
jgi:hypothetical protein